MINRPFPSKVSRKYFVLVKTYRASVRTPYALKNLFIKNPILCMNLIKVCASTVLCQFQLIKEVCSTQVFGLNKPLNIIKIWRPSGIVIILSCLILGISNSRSLSGAVLTCYPCKDKLIRIEVMSKEDLIREGALKSL